MKVLIVDDQYTNLLLFKTLVSKIDGSEVVTFEDPLQALDWCQKSTADLVILDYMMPRINGLEFVARFRQLKHCDDVPLLMITADHEKELRYQALQNGVNDFLTKPIDKFEFQARVKNMLLIRQQQLALKDRAIHLEMEVEKATEDIRQREQETINRLSYAAEFRDPETGAHILRMSHYALLIAQKLKLPGSQQNVLLQSAPMHDIGKVGIPDHILLKPGPLTDDEFTVIKMHPRIGNQILAGSRAELLCAAAEISLTHHEKFDGSGYPQGLYGDQIPLFGRICAVADVFDALTSARPYKKAWPVEQAIAVLKDGAGSHFDPGCVKAFLSAPDAIETIRTTYMDENPAEKHLTAGLLT